MAESVWIAAPGMVEVREEALPAVGPGHVRVRALVSGISHGTEMLVYRGQAPPDLSLDLPTLQGSFRFPIKYGYASVGRVAAVGPGVEDLRPGDLVLQRDFMRCRGKGERGGDGRDRPRSSAAGCEQ
jgi:NADPH:quinone reductase-like Zn-dependent oxidoreductase